LEFLGAPIPFDIERLITHLGMAVFLGNQTCSLTIGAEAGIKDIFGPKYAIFRTPLRSIDRINCD